MSTTVELHRVKAELAALRAGVEALSDEWGEASCEEGLSLSLAFAYAAHSLRVRRLLLGDPA